MGGVDNVYTYTFYLHLIPYSSNLTSSVWRVVAGARRAHGTVSTGESETPGSGLSQDGVGEPSSWKFATQVCISWQIGQSWPRQSWSASTETKRLEKAIVATTNAAQSPDKTRRLCAFGRKTLRSAENIGAYYIKSSVLLNGQREDRTFSWR